MFTSLICVITKYVLGSKPKQLVVLYRRANLMEPMATQEQQRKDV